MILLTFYETLKDLSEARGGLILQNTSMAASDTRFHFCAFFLCLQQSNKQDPQHCARLNFSF